MVVTLMVLLQEIHDFFHSLERGYFAQKDNVLHILKD
jgi:hypothetical protein